MRETLVVTGLLPRLLQRLQQLEGFPGQYEQEENSASEKGIEFLEDPLSEEKKRVEALVQAKLVDSEENRRRRAFWAKGTGYGTGRAALNEPSDVTEKKLKAKKAFKEQATAISRQSESIFAILSAFITEPPLKEGAVMVEKESSGKVKRRGSSRRKSTRKSQRVKEKVVIVALVSERAQRLLTSASLLDVLRSKARTTALLDMVDDAGVYTAVLQFVECVARSKSGAKAILWDDCRGDSVLQLLEKAVEPMEIARNASLNVQENDEEQALRAGRILEQFFMTIAATREAHAQLEKGARGGRRQESGARQKEKAAKNPTKAYNDALSDHQFGEMELCEAGHYHYSRESGSIQPQTVQRIVTEISSLAGNMPLHPSSSVFLRVDSSRVNCMRALITGPANTPYANGCFLCMSSLSELH